MSKQYIDKEEWVERLEEELSTCKNEKRKEYLSVWINAIKCQPTVSEKEIIRNPMERIVERLEEAAEKCIKIGDVYGFSATNEAIFVVKEVGGIDG